MSGLRPVEWSHCGVFSCLWIVLRPVECSQSLWGVHRLVGCSHAFSGLWGVHRPVECSHACAVFSGLWSVLWPVEYSQVNVECFHACTLFSGLWSVLRPVGCSQIKRLSSE